MVQHMICTAGI